MIQVIKLACGEEEISVVKQKAVEELKEKLWKEVWKENIELPQVDFDIRSLGDGLYQVIAKTR